MLELFIWYGIILLSSLILRYIRRLRIGPFRVLLNILSFVGVIVHEASHFVLALLFGVKIKGIRVNYHDRWTGAVAPNGAVGLDKTNMDNSVLQMLMAAMAPLFVSTFLFMVCLDLIFTLDTNAGVNVVAGFCAISLLIGSKPSGADLQQIGKAFYRDVRYSLYQLTLVGIAILFVWFVVDLSMVALPFEVLYYIVYFLLVIVLYFVLKGIGLGLRYLYLHIVGPVKVSGRRMTRRRYKPINPKKLGIEEPHW